MKIAKLDFCILKCNKFQVVITCEFHQKLVKMLAAIWSKIFVLITFIGLLSFVILMIYFIGYATDIDSEQLKERDARFNVNAQNVHMNEYPDHLFWFVQVNIEKKA